MLETIQTILTIVTLLQGPAVPAPAGQASLKLPAQIQAQPGQPFAVVCEGNLKWIRWSIPTGLVRVPPELTAAGDRGFVGYGPAGVYEFKVEGTLHDEFKEAKCVVFVGQPQPIPPGPAPGPVPPSDPLFVELQALYSADKSPTKAAAANSLASLYSTAGQAAIKDTSVTTTAQFLAKLRAASKLLLADDALRGIRDRLASEFALCLGTADAPLTPELRSKASDCLNRLASLVGALR